MYSLQPQNWGVEDKVLSSSIVSFFFFRLFIPFLSACSVESFMTMIIYFNSVFKSGLSIAMYYGGKK